MKKEMISLFGKIRIPLGILSFFSLCLFAYLYPLTKGLLLLPLDLLISNYSPWSMPNTILIKNNYMQDSIIQMFPWKHLTYVSWSNLTIPFWNPYQFLGMPFMASMKPLVFYPFNLLFILGEMNAWHGLLISQLFLSLVFMYLLSRDCKVSVLSSLVASLSFAFCSLMMAVLSFGSEGHVLMWLPAMVLCAKRFIDTQKRWYLLFVGVTISMAILAGQLQYFAYEMILLSSFILYYGRTRNIAKNEYGLLGVAGILGILLTSFQLFPGIELFSYSYRGIAHSYSVFAEGLMSPLHIFRLLGADLFGNPVTRDVAIGYIEESGYFGIISLFFALTAIWSGWRNTLVRYFSILFFVGILFSMQGFGSILYFLHIPLITSGSAGRIFSLTLFTGALLSGFGMDYFLARSRKKQIQALGGFLLVFIIGTGISMFFSSDTVTIRNIWFPIAVISAFVAAYVLYVFLQKRLPVIKVIFSLGIVFLVFFDLFRLGYRFITFSNDKFLYPQTAVVSFLQNKSQTELGRSFGIAESEIASYLQIQSVETYNPLYPMRTAAFLNALQGKSGDLPKNKYYLSRDARLMDTLNFLGVSYIVSSKEVNPATEYLGSHIYEKNLQKVYTDERYSIYRNSASLPRFGMYYRAQTLPEEEILQHIQDRKVDFTTTLLLEESVPAFTQGSSSAHLTHSTVNSQEFSVTSSTPGLFYVSDSYFPGWKAYINNQETQLYRANYAFRAIIIPSGKNSITFTYLPSNFVWYLWVSVLSGVILLILGFFPSKLKKSNI